MAMFFTKDEAESLIGEPVRCIAPHRAEPDEPGDVRGGDAGHVWLAEPVRGKNGTGYMIVIKWEAAGSPAGSYVIGDIGSQFGFERAQAGADLKGLDLEAVHDPETKTIENDDDIPW